MFASIIQLACAKQGLLCLYVMLVDLSLFFMSGLRKLEAFFAFLITVMAVSFGYEVWYTGFPLSWACYLIIACEQLVSVLFTWPLRSHLLDHGHCNICGQFPKQIANLAISLHLLNKLKNNLGQSGPAHYYVVSCRSYGKASHLHNKWRNMPCTCRFNCDDVLVILRYMYMSNKEIASLHFTVLWSIRELIELSINKCM